MSFLKNVAIVGLLSAAFFKGCEYLVTDKVKQITGAGEPENTQVDTQERFRGYGQEFRKGVEGFIEGVTTDPDGKSGGGVLGESQGEDPNRTLRLDEMCLDPDPANCPR